MSDRYPVLARYNAWANHKLYDACERLSDDQFRADRGVFFRSLHGTLNHLLVVDTLWMARLAGAPVPALRLDTVLHDDFDALRAARGEADTGLITRVDGLDAEALRATFEYTPAAGGRYVAQVGPTLDHLFNHQTHHRGQCHAVLTGLGAAAGRGAGAAAPALDLMAFYNEVGHGGLVRLF